MLAVKCMLSVLAAEPDNYVITGFEDSGIMGDAIYLNKNSLPSLKELNAVMPEYINVRVGNTVTALGVRWESVTGDYGISEDYYYQFNPVFDGGYVLSEEINPEDIPYIPVFIYEDDMDNACVSEITDAGNEYAELLGTTYLNEGAVYSYITGKMGLGTAAACGIMANIQMESSFNPKAQSPGGSYGICQWTGNRYTDLQNYCTEKNLDYTTLDGQLEFLYYELSVKSITVWKYMKEISDSEDGAYKAGYYWCYNYERPSNRENKSVEMGNLAKNTYWQKYGSEPVSENTKATEIPQPTGMPNLTGTPQPTGKPNPTGTPQPTGMPNPTKGLYPTMGIVPTVSVSEISMNTVSAPAVEKRRISADRKFSFILGDTITVSYPGIPQKVIESKGNAGIYRKETGEIKLTEKGRVKLFYYDGNKRKNICTIRAVLPRLKESYTLAVGKEKKLKPKLSVEMGRVLWISSNERILTVKDGVLSPHAEGNARVTLYVNGHKFCIDVTVMKSIKKKKH